MNKITVFFSEQMVVNKDLESPSPKKPKAVVNEWKNLFPIEIKNVTPVSLEQILAVHDQKFVNGIMSGKKNNGFRTKDKEVIDSLPYTSGSFLDAAREALKNKTVAVSPTSGFHHATYNEAMGYCTFNGLMISAYELLKNNEVSHISILDCDHHYGNGTDDIITTLSLENKINHITARKDYPYNSSEFFEKLEFFLLSFKKSDILFYQAGADCHIDDPFGGFLTTEEMKKRDSIVFQFCKNNNLPVVWNLAGGYQETILEDGTRDISKVLNLHNNTMEECVKTYIKV